MNKDNRRHGSGPSKLQLGFEHCRESLVDFQVLPHVVDAQGFARLFKVVKLWELHVAEHLLSLPTTTTTTSGHAGDGGGGFFGEYSSSPASSSLSFNHNSSAHGFNRLVVRISDLTRIFKIILSYSTHTILYLLCLC